MIISNVVIATDVRSFPCGRSCGSPWNRPGARRRFRGCNDPTTTRSPTLDSYVMQNIRATKTETISDSSTPRRRGKLHSTNLKVAPTSSPNDPKCISSAFTEACQFLGIDDLRFHDLRHEAVSRLFEEGYDIHDVPLISLHQSWEDLKRYTNLRPETMREITTLEDGSRVIRIASTTRRTLASPPAKELIPPMTRRSRSRIFTLSD
jgi:Phage integrase family